MTDPRDQVLAHALRQVLGAPTDDLSWRVVSQWRGGADADPERAVRTPRRWPWALLVAAGAALVVLTVRPWQDRVVGDGHLDRPALIASAGRWSPTVSTRLAHGQTIASERGTEVSWPDGTRIELAPGTVARLVAMHGTSGLRLLQGGATLTCGDDGPFVLAVERASVTAQPSARVRVRSVHGGVPYTAIPSTFSSLAEDLHMNHLAPAAIAAFTLLSGTAVLHDGSRSAPLSPNQSVTAPQDPTDEWQAALAKLAGTWDLTITDFRGDQKIEVEGSEVCRVPPGGRWLLSDMTARRPNGTTTWAHTVLGYEKRTGTWTGTFVDNFGGSMGLLSGPIGDDPSTQTLTMRAANGRDFGIRSTMRWINDRERRTEIEVKVEDEWQRMRVMVHRRRK